MPKNTEKMEKILKCRQEHPDWGYLPISMNLGIPMSTVRYYLQNGGPQKSLENIDKYRSVSKVRNSFILRIKSFRKNGGCKKDFTYHDVMKKIGQNPKCYLTGISIDLNNTKSYQFDHIIPHSKGGSGELENLGIALSRVNTMKQDMTKDEFLDMCKIILEYNGFKITKL